MSRLSPPTEPSREWNCNLKLIVAWSAAKTFLFLEKMLTRNLQLTPKMISKSSVPIDLFTAGCVENLGTDPGLKLQTHNLLYSWKCYRIPFVPVEVKREILAIFPILLEALQPHLCQLKYYVSRQITVYSEARSSVLRCRIKFEVDCNVDIIYIRSSVDSIAILISLFVLINRSSVEESNRFKISLEGILCESKKNCKQFDYIQFKDQMRH